MKFMIARTDSELLAIYNNGRIVTVSDDEARTIVLRYGSVDALVESEAEDIFREFKDRALVTLSDDGKLTFHDSEFFQSIVMPDEFPYYTTQEFAAITNHQARIVQRHCSEGRIKGAVNMGRTWYIPKTAEYPKDQRAGRDMSKRYAKKTQE